MLGRQRRLELRPSSSSLQAKRGVHPQARFVKSQDRIAQRPVMARWNRLAGSINKPGILRDLVLLKGVRPYKVLDLFKQ